MKTEGVKKKWDNFEISIFVIVVAYILQIYSTDIFYRYFSIFRLI